MRLLPRATLHSDSEQLLPRRISKIFKNNVPFKCIKYKVILIINQEQNLDTI